MFGDRYQITLSLEVTTPLHIGSGSFSRKEELTHESVGGEERAPGVACIVKDQDGRPYIPGSTIKGILRTLLKQENETTKLLFGDTELSKEANNPNEEETIVAVMAKCYFHNAYIDKASIPKAANDKLDQLPMYDERTAIAVVTRNAIDRVFGVAEDKHLFYMEVTPPGVRFNMRLTLFSDEGGQIGLLLALLGQLGDSNGVSFGRNQNAGYGRLRADRESLKITKQELDDEGNLKTKSISLSDLKLSEPDNRDLLGELSNPFKLRLCCHGPFIVVGERTTSISTDAGDRQAQLHPLRLDSETPWLPGSSLKGVLRSECLQLVARKRLVEGKEAEQLKIDNRNRILNPRSRLANAVTRQEELTSVERLFGVGGWRGLLHISEIKLVNNPEELDLTSVKLDRFSGGPIDNALFKTSTFLSPEFELTLSLERRDAKEDQEVQTVYEELIKHICDNGLMLGHGGNKGFGWFDVMEIDCADEERA